MQGSPCPSSQDLASTFSAGSPWHLFITGTGDEAGEVILTGFGSNEHQEIFALGFADGKYRAEPFRHGAGDTAMLYGTPLDIIRAALRRHSFTR